MCALLQDMEAHAFDKTGGEVEGHEHIHENIGQSVEITIERAASTKGVIGLKVKVVGDDPIDMAAKLRWAIKEAEVVIAADLAMKGDQN